MRWQGFAYRAHDPRWAFAPLSGEGAAIHGGRFNAVGKPALYLARTIEGMISETSHGFAYRFPPLTICTYQVDVDNLVDLSADIAASAARLGASLGLRIADATQAASVLAINADALVTHDRDFGRVRTLRVLSGFLRLANRTRRRQSYLLTAGPLAAKTGERDRRPIAGRRSSR